MKDESDKIDYGEIPFSEQRKLDQLAYAKYYDGCIFDETVLTFNGWYGTDLHQKYIQIYLRKEKLDKIKKRNQ